MDDGLPKPAASMATRRTAAAPYPPAPFQPSQQSRHKHTQTGKRLHQHPLQLPPPDSRLPQYSAPTPSRHHPKTEAIAGYPAAAKSYTHTCTSNNRTPSQRPHQNTPHPSSPPLLAWQGAQRPTPAFARRAPSPPLPGDSPARVSPSRRTGALLAFRFALAPARPRQGQHRPSAVAHP